jgi:hypothetical protein
MNKIVLVCCATLSCFALTACNTVTATAPSGVKQTGYNSVAGTTPSNGAATQGAATRTARYDSSCQAQSSPESKEYSNCLQKLPASALVGSGVY